MFPSLQRVVQLPWSWLLQCVEWEERWCLHTSDLSLPRGICCGHTCLCFQVIFSGQWFKGIMVPKLPLILYHSRYPWCLQSKLSLEWRQWMTENMLQDYFSNRSFYMLMSAPAGTEGSVDNPDQRISSDVKWVYETIVLYYKPGHKVVTLHTHYSCQS